MISTIHSAKGMEWDNVYILNVVEGSFPNEFAAGKAETHRGRAPPAVRRDDPRAQ